MMANVEEIKIGRFKIGTLEIPHQLILAPMCGITHKAYRRVCKEYGAGLVVNQMVSAKALVMGDKKSHDMLRYDEKERPVGLQLFGNNANELALAAQIAQDTGVDLVDLNMGCPAKKIVGGGGGSALLNDLPLVKKIFEKMRKVLRIPFTIKLRAGIHDREFQAFEVAKMAEKSGVDAIALHARSRQQGYSGHADWNLIRQLKDGVSLPVIGNGDVIHYHSAYRMLKETGCDAVMTGRGATEAPWIFRSFVEKKEYAAPLHEIKELILRQYEYFFELFGIDSGIKQMRKHLCFYSKGLKGGAEFRNTIVRLDDWSRIRGEVDIFFKS